MPDTTTQTRPVHTPGPWHARGADGYAHVGGGNPVFKIADVSCGRPERAEDRANGRLIAAAPELLAVLLKLRRGDLHQRVRPLWDEAQAAIAKATGSAS